MRNIKLLFILLMVGTGLAAQKGGSIKGIVIDTLAKQPVASATITVLGKKDSSLVTFTQTDYLGHFELKGIPNGDYRLLITHVNYNNSNSFFKISDEVKNLDLGNRILNDKNKVLEEVVVNDEAPPVTLINDTIQYNANSFRTPPNASVEQLLKKLPGIKVEKDGTVKAQGEKVNRVLVDGKEFFGNDPKVATKNLPADAVDKVQVYDRQSDQAQLTGFEDGNYEKTINLKLKKDKKKGLFGKINGGAGTDQRYEGRFNLNSFKGARQLSAIGMANNTNAEGFSFMDILNFTGELARMQKGSGGGGDVNINISGDDAAALGAGAGSNSGITSVWGGGLNYNNIIGNKLDFQSNYFFNQYDPNKESHIARQYFLPDSTYYSSQNSFEDRKSNTHRLNLNLLFQLDSMSTLRIIPSFSYQQSNNRTHSDYETLSGAHLPVNRGFSDIDLSGTGFNFRNEISYRKKFKRKGRTFSLNLQTSLNESDGDGSLYSVNRFFNADGSGAGSDTLNQQNHTRGHLGSYAARATYTEPVWRKSLIEFSAGHSNSRSTAEKTTNDFNEFTQKFDQVNDLLSNDFESTYSYSNGGIRFRTQKRKYFYSFGATWQGSSLEGRIRIPGVGQPKDSVIAKNFNNVLPSFRMQYNFSKFKSISLNYSASTNQPSITQLQPVPDNSDPLNIAVGNPQLKQEYIHSINGNLTLVSPYKSKNLFLFFNMAFTRNKIVNNDIIDQFGIRTTTPVNVNGILDLNSNLVYSFPVRFLKGNLELSSDFSYGREKQLLNNAVNAIRTINLGPGLRLDMSPTDKLSFTLGSAIRFNHSSYSLQQRLGAQYLSQEYSASMDWELPRRFFLSSDFTYILNSQRAAGFNTHVPLWNASISRQILHFNRGEIKLAARDLLNKNIGISRTTNQNYVQDSRVMTLKRFFLLSFTYSLSRTGLNNAGGGGIRVINR